MSRTQKIALAAAILGGILLLLRPYFASERAPKSAAAGSSTKPDVDRQQRRAHKDVNQLARALSMVAAQPLGLVQVRGRVLDRESGEPIAAAEVLFTGPSGETSAQCDSEGRYELELLPGFYRSYAQAPHYVAVAPAAAERLPDHNLAESVSMPRASIAPLVGLFRNQRSVDHYLSGGATVVARVLDSEGTPIEGAIVAALSSSRMQLLSGTDVGESDESGIVDLRVPAGMVRFRAQHQEYAGAKATTRVHLQSGKSGEVDIVLLRGCIIEGEVVHEGGMPALTGALEKRAMGTSFVPAGTIQGARIRYTQRHEGPVILRAWPWKSPPSNEAEYACTQGAHFKDQVFVVPEGEALLTGHIESYEGKRIPFAFVDTFALQAGLRGQQERADDKGEFEFFALGPGPYQLSAYVPGQGAVNQLIEVPSTGVPLRLSGTGAIIGTLPWLKAGSATMHYRCAHPLDQREFVRRDDVSMPMQRALLPIDNHHFRVEDVPACPIEGSVRSQDRSEYFRLEVKRNQDAMIVWE